MALVRWDPWSDMLSMQRDMQDLVRRLLGDWEGVPLRSSAIRSWFPAIDVFAPDGTSS